MATETITPDIELEGVVPILRIGDLKKGIEYFLHSLLASRRFDVAPKLAKFEARLAKAPRLDLQRNRTRNGQSGRTVFRASRLTNVTADKHFSDAASPQW